MLILKQSTAIDIRMGPFVDATDGVTPETGITLGAADQAEVLKANGAATAAMSGTFAAVTGADGWYDYTASTTDTNTVGEVVFVVQDSSVCLPVFTRAYVVEEALYDALYGASATGFNSSGQVTVGTIASGAVSADALASNAITAAKIATGAIDADAIASNAITAAKLASDCITAAKIATDAIGSDELAASAITEIWNNVVETEGSYTAQQVMSICLAVLAGVTSNGGATLETPNGNANRVVATVNGSNERTAVTVTPSS